MSRRIPALSASFALALAIVLNPLTVPHTLAFDSRGIENGSDRNVTVLDRRQLRPGGTFEVRYEDNDERRELKLEALDEYGGWLSLEYIDPATGQTGSILLGTR